MEEYPKRKTIRLKNYDYNSPGAYFITICTKNREEMLSEIIVGTDVLGGPHNNLTEYGNIADRYIINMNNFYDNISVDKYVIMPNHIHLLIRIIEDKENEAKYKCGKNGPPRTSDNGPPRTSDNGPPRTSVPTRDSVISRFVSTFKRFCNREIGENIWQYRSHDHIIRNEKEYQKIWEYIETNPLKWEEDCFNEKLL